MYLIIKGNFFLHSKKKKNVTIDKDNLYSYVVPCWSPASEDFINTYVHDTLRVFDRKIIEAPLSNNVLALSYMDSDPAQKKNIINYILHCTIGDSIRHIGNKDNFEELDQFDTNHINLWALSDRYGEYQIRIREFRNRSNLYFQGLKEEYEIISLYYSHINQLYSQKCPGFYQYRYFTYRLS